MAFADDIAKLSDQVRVKAELVKGEEATKMSLIVPFLHTLGYDVFDPTEVVPEYVADFAERQGGRLEKVDYAIAINGNIIMLIEAKARDQKPNAHDKQLKKYFSTLVATRVGVVTNGVEYRFFTDLQHEHLMDDDPFFCFNILDYDQKQLEHLKFFHRDNFDVNQIKSHAEGLIYLTGMNQLVNGLLRSPSDAFIKFLVGEMGDIGSRYKISPINKRVIDRFRPIVKKSLQDALVGMMTQSITREMGEVSEPSLTEQLVEIEEEIEETDPSEAVKVETTEEELEAFEKVKSIVSKSKTFQLPIQHKDVSSYFGLNVGKTTWWFIRFYLSQKKKNFVTRLPIDTVRELAPGFEVQEMTASFGDATCRVIISSVSDLDKLSNLILKCYETESEKHIKTA